MVFALSLHGRALSCLSCFDPLRSLTFHKSLHIDPGTAFHEEESFRHTKRRMTQTTTKTQKYLLSSWRKRVVDEWSGCEVLSAVDFCNT
eukprot:m.294204 g.294204  ORF g.294204 m.294204 type:complete len:89 (+) comp15849_c0_seq7:71-337(+)